MEHIIRYRALRVFGVRRECRRAEDTHLSVVYRLRACYLSAVRETLRRLSRRNNYVVIICISRGISQYVITNWTRCDAEDKVAHLLWKHGTRCDKHAKSHSLRTTIETGTYGCDVISEPCRSVKSSSWKKSTRLPFRQRISSTDKRVNPRLHVFASCRVDVWIRVTSLYFFSPFCVLVFLFRSGPPSPTSTSTAVTKLTVIIHRHRQHHLRSHRQPLLSPTIRRHHGRIVIIIIIIIVNCIVCIHMFFYPFCWPARLCSSIL